MTHPLNRRRFVRAALATPFALLTGLASTRSNSQAPGHASKLLALMRIYLESLPDRRLRPFLDEWPAGVNLRRTPISTLPVLKYRSSIQAQAPARSRPLLDELFRISAHLAWRQSYSVPVLPQQFLDNYGYAEIAGLTGPIPSERLAAGFLVLGPDTFYPTHRHEAEEVYVPLSGTARWQGRDAAWREEAPGSVVFHERQEPHAMRTGSQPLLALYLWRSHNLDQKSQLDPA